MPTTINKFKQHQVLYVNILFTLFCVLFNLSLGLQFAWFAMWFLVPLMLPTNKSFQCLIYMSLYMRIINSVKLFSILICTAFFIVLIKELLFLNKNKLLNKYFKILIFYLFLIILPLFYSILINKSLNINFVYYLNMINLLFLFYLLKNKLNKNTILIYCYGLIISSALSLICFVGGLHQLPFNGPGYRFCAFLPLCNTLSACCVICICLIYVLFINSQLSRNHSISLIIILSLLGLVTLSKNFFITFILTLLVILINQFRQCTNKKKFIKIGTISIIVLSPLILYYGIVMFERFFMDYGYSNIFDNITTGRLDKWMIYLKPWAKHLYSILFGLGLGFNYNTLYSSHSIYIGYLSKIGIIGLVLIGAFIYLITTNNKTKIKLKYFPIIIALLICLAEDMSYNTFNFVPFIIGLMSTKDFNNVQ